MYCPHCGEQKDNVWWSSMGEDTVECPKCYKHIGLLPYATFLQKQLSTIGDIIEDEEYVE